MTDNDGIALGRHYDEARQTVGKKVVYAGERHVLLFGPNGTGKGTRFLIPNLLSIKDRSIIVVDPKGELASVTADYRRTVGDVVMLNPFDVLGLGSAGFNPSDTLDPKSPNFYDDAAALGEALIKMEGKDPHWSESAQGLLVALIMWDKLKNGARANLENVRALLTQPDTWERYTGDDGKVRERQTGGLRVTAADMIAEGGYAIASLAARFAEQTNEISSIRSTADTQTRWILSEPMRGDLKKPGVQFSKLKEKPTTVYVILPAERMRTHSVWLRLVIVSALRALYRPGGLRTLLLIDEMPALGHLGPLEDAFGLVRGYKVQIAGICQDLAQLKALYKERWESFLANAGGVDRNGLYGVTVAILRRSAARQARGKMPDQATTISAGVKMPNGVQKARPKSVVGRQLGDNQPVAEIEAGSFGNGGGHGNAGQDRGGGAGRKAHQKVAPVDLHAPALSSPASAARENHIRRLLPSLKERDRDLERFAHFVFDGRGLRVPAPLRDIF